MTIQLVTSAIACHLSTILESRRKWDPLSPASEIATITEVRYHFLTSTWILQAKKNWTMIAITAFRIEDIDINLCIRCRIVQFNSQLPQYLRGRIGLMLNTIPAGK